MSESKGPAATANTSLQVVVDRSKWLRGGGAGAKLLQPRTGHKCIIGEITTRARHQLWLHGNANPFAAVRIRI